MTTFPGTPDLIVDLNSGGTTNGSFIVRESGGATFLSLPSTGAGAGNLTLSGDLLFQATSTPKSVEATSGTLTLRGSEVRVGDGVNYIEIDHDGINAEMSLVSTDSLALIGNEIRLTGTGTGPGTALVRIQDASTSPREDRLVISQATSGEVLIETPVTSAAMALRLASAPGTLITLDGSTRLLESLQVDTGGITVVSGNVSLNDGNLKAKDTEAMLTLESTGAGESFQWRATGAGTLVLSKDDGTGLTEVFTFSRFADSTGWVTELRGPTATGSLPEEVAIVADSALTMQASETVSLHQTDENAGLNLYSDSGPRAFLFAGDPSSLNPGIISLGVNDVGFMRVARYRPGLPIPDDRLVVTGAGLLSVYPDTSTGSPGSNAILTIDAVTTPSEAVLTVGPAVSGSGIRGRILTGWDGVGAPGLFVLEADDGTPVYLSLWKKASGKYDLTASLALPSSPTSGQVIAGDLT